MVVGRRGPVRAAGLLILAAALLSRPVQAFCRSTTCSLGGCVPRECLRDDAGADPACSAACPPATCRAKDDQGCVSKGIPLFWAQGCLSFSVQSTGSPALGLGYDDLVPVVEKAF